MDPTPLPITRITCRFEIVASPAVYTNASSKKSRVPPPSSLVNGPTGAEGNAGRSARDVFMCTDPFHCLWVARRGACRRRACCERTRNAATGCSGEKIEVEWCRVPNVSPDRCRTIGSGGERGSLRTERERLTAAEAAHLSGARARADGGEHRAAPLASPESPQHERHGDHQQRPRNQHQGPGGMSEMVRGTSQARSKAGGSTEQHRAQQCARPDEMLSRTWSHRVDFRSGVLRCGLALFLSSGHPCEAQG